jgi:uncharacterized protein (DUF1800 family)
MFTAPAAALVRVRATLPLCLMLAATAPFLGATARPDFDGDGKADVLWRDARGGPLRLWLMNGTSLASQGDVDAQSDPGWRAEALADFDGDGRADVLWRHVDSGENQIWRMSSFALLGRWNLPTLIDSDWRVAHSADFDGDGSADILWRHEATGAHALWSMRASGPVLPPARLVTRALTWRIVAAGDLDGDGKADLVWRDERSGVVEACRMAGAVSLGCASSLPVQPAPWRVAGVADANGDGRADLLWRLDPSTTRLWLMEGTSLRAAYDLALPEGAQIVTYADVSGDQRADLLWRLPGDPNVHVWLLNAATLAAQGLLSGLPETYWSAAPQPAPLPPTPPEPPSSAPPGPIEAARFLEQAGFGPTPASVARVQQIGYAAYLDEQFAAPLSTYYDFVSTAPTTNDTNRNNALRTRFFMNALNGPDQLRQRVAFALSQILVVSSNDINDGPGLALYADILTRNAFGNYRALLDEVTLSPAMGNYLDMVNNDKPNLVTGRQANENYARELLQLFSIGLVKLYPNGTPKRDGNGVPLATYGQDEVEGLARVFTGWTYAPRPGATPQAHNPTYYLAPMVLWPANHDTGEKRILDGRLLPAGQSGEQDLRAALDAIFQHPNVGPFIARQLIQHLVTSNPSPGYVARVAAAFDGAGTGVRGDLRATLRTLLLDPEARREPGHDATFGRLREPVQFMLALLRGLGATGQGYGLVSPATGMAQNPWSAPSVFNFYSPSYRLPGTALLAPTFQIYAESTAIRRSNFVNTLVYGSVGLPSYAPAGATSVTLDFAPWIALASDPAALVAALDQRLMGGRMPADMRAVVTQAVANTAASSPTNRAKTALYLVATAPQYQIQR